VSEVEFRFPSDQPYAYFAVKGTPEELAQIDYEMLAALYVNTQLAVLKGTVSAKDAILSGPSERAPERPTEQPKDDGPSDASEAAEALSEGLGGATEIDDVNAPPWEKPAPKAKTPAWEKPKPKPEVDVSSSDFDF
jgi:hypothetical protein